MMSERAYVLHFKRIRLRHDVKPLAGTITSVNEFTVCIGGRRESPTDAFRVLIDCLSSTHNVNFKLHVLNIEQRTRNKTWNVPCSSQYNVPCPRHTSVPSLQGLDSNPMKQSQGNECFQLALSC